MSELWYNTGANHIKSGEMLIASRLPFSTYERGVDTMSDHTTSTPLKTKSLHLGDCLEYMRTLARRRS